ncbi:MAG: ribonuclease D [Rhodospirillales bacterium]
MPMISDTASLKAFCQALSSADYITVDTEFMREKTYWPQLCLVQVAGPDDAKAIDALAPDMDLTPLFELLDDKKILKVFHAARQDLEIFYHLSGRLPEPVFDTQVAAMVCGFGDSAGYETLVTTLTKARVDKGSRFTDWTARPLSDRQISYALADVTHLRDVYESLRKRLGHNGREAWLAEEMATLTDPKTYDADPYEIYKRIKSGNARPKTLAILRELAAWREEEARRRDLPRNRVIRDEQILEIAHHPPEKPADLARIRGLGNKFAEGSAGQAIIEAAKRGFAVPESERPRPKTRPRVSNGIGPASQLLKVLLKMRCDEHEVAQKLLASSDDIESLAAYADKADVAVLKGWRHKVFGEDALRLLRGEIALAVKNGKIIIVEHAD